MNFSDITNWTIPEGTVKQITDSLDRVIWRQPQPVSADYFYVQDISGQDNTLSIKGTSFSPTIEVFKSTDQQNWSSMGTTSFTTITATIPANGRLYLKATANAWSSDTANTTQITTAQNCNVGGNIMSLLYNDNFVSQTTLSTVNTFMYLFNNSTNIVSAENLVLPATTLADSCYYSMFYGCSSLTTAPATLPATTLVSECYGYMFYGCSSLTTAPVLPVTTLNYYSCRRMFRNCTSLTTAPALPATTLVTGCYKEMFRGCTNLNSVTTYATNISASDCLTDWLSNVAATGDFYNLGSATYPSGASGIPSGWTEHTSL